MNLISENLWYVDYDLKRFPTLFNIKMVIVRLPSGGLWLHSPIPIDDGLSEKLTAIGRVDHIIAPSCFHHLFAKQAKEMFPDAKLWASPGLPDKRKDINFDSVLNEDVPEWVDTIEYQFIGGMPWINETVFFHKPSRTLICSDFVFNITKEDNLFMKILWKLSGTYKKFGQSREWRWLVRNVFDNVDSVNKILKWDFEKIVMGHGEIINCTNQELFEVINKGSKNFYTGS